MNSNKRNRPIASKGHPNRVASCFPIKTSIHSFTTQKLFTPFGFSTFLNAPIDRHENFDSWKFFFFSTEKTSISHSIFSFIFILVPKASGSVSSISPQSSKSSDYGHDDTASDHLTDSKESDSLQRISRKKMIRSGSPDYRVVSLDEKPDPGRLDDFVPEVERDGRRSGKFNNGN